MHSHHACHHAAVHHAMAHHVNHAAAAHMAMRHFGGGAFGGGTHVYHHHHHTNGTRTNHNYYQAEPEPQYEYKNIDEVKTHLLKHLTVAHYRTADDFENLVQLFVAAKISMTDKVEYLKACVKGLSVPYYWDKYTDIIAQLPRVTANINELIDVVIPFHLSLTKPTYENAARDIDHYHRNFIAAIDKHYLSESILIKDFCRLLNAHQGNASMADILDYSSLLLAHVDNALMNDSFEGEANVVKIIKNMPRHQHQVFGKHHAAHSIMEKLLKKGVDANELFSFLTPVYGLDCDLLKYAHLLHKFANHGIDVGVIKAKLHTDLTMPVNTHIHIDGTHDSKPKYKTLGKNFGPIFCRLAEYDLLPKVDYSHDMRRAIFKEILKLPAAKQSSLLYSILNHDNNDIGQLFWRVSYHPILFGDKVKLPDYWKHKVDDALAKLPVEEDKMDNRVKI